MRQPGWPSMRARGTLVIACYVIVLACGAFVHHHHAGEHTHHSHCSVCACLETVPLVATAPEAPEPLARAERVDPAEPHSPDIVVRQALTARAPPSSTWPIG